jgi:hypothetical protein
MANWLDASELFDVIFLNNFDTWYGSNRFCLLYIWAPQETEHLIKINLLIFFMASNCACALEYVPLFLLRV